VARAPKAGIDVTVDERPAIAGLKRLTKEFGTTAIAINQAAELGLKAWGAITGVIGGAVSAVVDATKASMEVERVERRAFAAMQSRAGMTREEFAALGALNDQRERQLNIDADEQLQLQGTLAALGVRKEALNAATEATIGLAEVTGQGLAEAGKKVAQVLGGNVNALKELGIQARDVADAQGQLQAFFVMAQAQADTLETSVAALGHQWGTLQETLGQVITQSPEVKGAIDALVIALTDVTDWLSSTDGKQAAREFFAVMIDGAASAINAMLGLRRALQDLSGEGDQQSALSRVGAGIEYAFQSVNVAGLTYATVTGQIQQRSDMLAELEDRIMGRGGSRPEDSPAIVALEQLANRFTRVAAEARKAEIVILDPETGQPFVLGGKPGKPPKGGGGGNGGGGAARKQDRTRHIAVDQELFGATEAEQFRALNERLAADARLMEMERGVAQREAARSEFEQRMALMQELHDREIEFSASMSTAMLEQTKAEADARQQVLASVAAQTRDTLGQQMAQMVVAVASGEQSLGKALESFVGGIVTSLGTMLIQLGTAAIAANLLSVVPVLGALVGPPGAGVGAGLAAIAAGASMVALGSLMGGGARAGGSTAPPMTGGGGGSAPRAPSLDTGRGFMPSFAMAGAAATPYTVNVNFNGVVGDERRAARMIEDTLRRGR
jgi:hypothetical protein